MSMVLLFLLPGALSLGFVPALVVPHLLLEAGLRQSAPRPALFSLLNLVPPFSHPPLVVVLHLALPLLLPL